MFQAQIVLLYINNTKKKIFSTKKKRKCLNKLIIITNTQKNYAYLKIEL